MNRATIYASIGAAAAIAVGALGFTPGTASATPTTGFLQTGAGPYDYNTAANWVGGAINGVWSSSLTLTAPQTVTIGATPATPTGLSFNYAGGGTDPTTFSLTLENTGGNQTFSLDAGQGITDSVGYNTSVTIQSANSAILTINLGGGTQTISDPSNSGNSNLAIGAVLANGSITTGASNGYVAINGLNTYTGTTTITSGQYIVNTLFNGGVASALGESSNAASNLVITGSGLLRYNGLAVASTDRLFTIGTGASIWNSANYALTFNNTGAIAFSTTGSNTTLSLQTGSSTFTFDPQIVNDGSGKTSVSVTTNNGSGEVVLNNAANSYTGVTSANALGTTLVVSDLALGGVASDVGASTNAATNFTFGADATLNYNGSGSTTDRNIQVGYAAFGKNGYGSATNIFTIENSGTGALVMTGAQAYNFIFNNGSTIPVSSNTINVMGMALDGSNPAGQVNKYNGAIVNGTAGSNTQLFVTALYTVTKSGTNTWALGGANTYTGATTVNGGALLITGSLASGSAVTVNTGGTLGGSGIIGGSVALASGSVLEPSFDSATPTTLTVGSLVAGSGSTIDLAVTGASTDSIVVTTSGGLTYAGTLAIADATPQVGVFQLFSFTGSPAGDFSAVTVNGASLTDPIGTWTGTSNGFDFSFVESTGVLTVSGTTIPEPAALSLMSLAGLGILLLGRKRKSA